MPLRRACHGISAQRIPTTASATSASGNKQTGRDSESRKARTSSVRISGTSDRSQSTIKTATAVVDQGNITAVRTASKSAYMTHADGPYHEVTVSEYIEALGVLFVA